MPLGPLSIGYVVDPTNGLDTNSGLHPTAALKTLAAAEDKTVANHHDVVLYIAASSATAGTAYDLEATLTWDKNMTHLIGIGAPTRTAQRARIFLKAGNNDINPMITWSASGCIVKNIYIFHGVADADSLICFNLTGGRNYFENVHFAGGGDATMAIDGGASLKLDAAEENTFVGCTIGVDTVDAATGMMGILFDTEAHRNVFERCIVRMRAGNAGAGFVEVVDATGIDRDNTFIDCLFLNNSGTAMDSGFVIPAGMGAPRKLFLKNCMIYGTTKLDANDRGVLFGNMNAVTGADGSGVAVQMVT